MINIPTVYKRVAPEVHCSRSLQSSNVQNKTICFSLSNAYGDKVFTKSIAWNALPDTISEQFQKCPQDPPI